MRGIIFLLRALTSIKNFFNNYLRVWARCEVPGCAKIFQGDRQGKLKGQKNWLQYKNGGNSRQKEWRIYYIWLCLCWLLIIFIELLIHAKIWLSSTCGNLLYLLKPVSPSFYFSLRWQKRHPPWGEALGPPSAPQKGARSSDSFSLHLILLGGETRPLRSGTRT